MKVLQVINSLGTGGAEKFVVQLVPALRRLGVATQLLVLDGQRTLYHDELEAAGVDDIRQLNLRRYYSPWAAARMVPQLAGFDLIHSHLFPTQYWVPLARLLRLSRVPLVTTEQNTHNRRRSIALFRLLDKHMYRRYHRVVTVSPLAQTYLDNYIASDATVVTTIPNAIDISRFDDATAADLTMLPGYRSGHCHVLQVSSFTPQKDHETLIRATARCPASVRLLLVGDGPQRPAMERLCATLGVTDRVHFLGIRGDIPALLAAADVAVMSSHHEGLSLAVLEAFAARRAFVGSDVPGLGDIAREGGLAVPPADVEALADTLTRLQDDPALRSRLAAGGRQVVTRYGIERIAAEYRDLYLEVLGTSDISHRS